MTDENNHSYQRKVLYQTSAFEVVAIDWNHKSVSAMHNHGWSQCLVLIESGVFENILDMGCKTEVQLLEVGQVLNTPLGSKHSIRCVSAKGRTLHVYTPRIEELSDAGRFHIESLAGIKKDLQLSQATPLDALRAILSAVRKHSITTESPYFMNQLFSGVMPQMLLAEELIAQTRTTLATHEASPALSAIEGEVVESLGEVIGWPRGLREGVAVPGGSAANFMAVHCARQKLIPEVKAKGMGGQAFKIFVSSQAHYSFKKACASLGVGTDNLVLVPTDANGRMVPENLDALLSEAKKEGASALLVSATAGTTVLGAFDPIDQIAKICKAHGVWLHVDAAWGGPALFSKQIRSLMNGIELADSVTFDAHKLFGASLTCSFFLTRHAGLLLSANDVSGADYLFHTEEVLDRGKLSWQCGRSADAVSFWTIWKSLGSEGLGQFVDRLLKIRDETLVWIQNQPRLELVADPVFLNICVRIIPPRTDLDSSEWSRLVRENLKNKNLAMVNYSTDSKGSFLRLILAHPYLQTDHVKQILQWSLEIE